MLVSAVNMLLRDEEFDTLESLCCYFDKEPEEIKSYLKGQGFVYDEEQKQFRPLGYKYAVIYLINDTFGQFSFVSLIFFCNYAKIY